MRSYFIIISFVVAVAVSIPDKLFSQQDPMYTMYMADKMLINPAFAGSSNWMVATAKYRQQFSGFAGHPDTKTINFHAPVQSKHLGVGVKLIYDKIGVTTNLNAAVLLSYHLNLSGGKLSAGIEAGIYNRKTDYRKLILSEQGDKVLPATEQSSTVPDVSWGLYYQKKQLYLGFSQYHLIKQKFDRKISADSKARLFNHVYFLIGNVFDVNKYWSVEPSILLKYQGASPLQLDINATVFYKEKVGLGLQYRTGDAVMAMIRIVATENIRVSYSYDLTLSQLRGYSSGAHEIVISYGIKLPPPPSQKVVHPRYYF